MYNIESELISCFTRFYVDWKGQTHWGLQRNSPSKSKVIYKREGVKNEISMPWMKYRIHFYIFYPVPPYKCELVVDSETVMGTHKSCLSRVQSPSLFLSHSQTCLWLPDDNFPILIRDGVVCSRYSFLNHKCNVMHWIRNIFLVKVDS